MTPTLVPFLMFEGAAEEALELYAAAFDDAEVVDVQRFGEEGWQMIGSTPEELRRWMTQEIDITKRLVKETGIKLEQ